MMLQLLLLLLVLLQATAAWSVAPQQGHLCLSIQLLLSSVFLRFYAWKLPVCGRRPRVCVGWCLEPSAPALRLSHLVTVSSITKANARQMDRRNHSMLGLKQVVPIRSHQQVITVVPDQETDRNHNLCQYVCTPYVPPGCHFDLLVSNKWLPGINTCNMANVARRSPVQPLVLADWVF